MEYLFENIERLVRSAVDAIRGPKAKGKSINRVRDAVQKEVDSVKVAFSLKALEFDAKGGVDRFVQYHQISLTRFIDDIHSSIHPEWAFLSDSLDSLIEFLRSSFSTNFRTDLAAPVTFRDRALVLAKEVSEKIQSHWHSIVDGPLVKLVQELLSNFLREAHVNSNFDRLSFIALLGARFNDSDSKLTTQAIRSHMIRANLNSAQFREYYIGFLRSRLTTAQTLAEQSELLALELKELGQTQVAKTAFDPAREDIRTQLLNWVVEEIQYLDARLKGSEPRAAAAGEHGADFKLVLDMSVAQLALFLKTLIETAVIQNKNLSEVLRFFAQSVKTKRSESVSYESLRIKYYNTEEATKQMVKVILGNCLKSISA